MKIRLWASVAAVALTLSWLVAGQMPSHVAAHSQQTPVKPLLTLDDLPGIAPRISTIVDWLDDDHFLQIKDGVLLRVDASTGQSEPFVAVDKVAEALAALPGLAEVARQLASDPHLKLSPDRAGAYFDHDGAIYYCNLDGSGASQITPKGKGKGAELSTPSPDGKQVAFVRDGNLFVTNKESKEERQLTKDGSAVITNGKADWVYFEEIFHRKWNAFWWSPDSAYIAFMRFDDTKVPNFTILDHTQRTQVPELTRYPKVGATNPTVKLGLAKIADGSVRWADIGYAPADFLISRVGWWPDSSRAFCYVQDRIQTWLDVCTVPVEGGKVDVLYRDKTKAWIEDLGALHFLKDGSFIAFSESSGYKHLYHRGADGKLKQALTQGEWDVKNLQKVDEAEGVLYFSGTKDGWLGSQAYRVKLDGTGLERITKDKGTHETLLSPGARYFLDTFSSYDTPPRIELCRADGTFVRLVDDAGPDQGKEKFQQGKHEFVEIKTPDGFVLNATVLLPPNFDKDKKYPVWFQTYAGPHAPTIRDKFTGNGARDQAMAAMGFIMFRADPRSASGKGAVSSWNCYKQLGVSETRDIETCIKWLLDTYPQADGKRVGMSGFSYGGYITAYCMTHTKLFAAGIAGAPVTDWHNYDSIYTERYMDLPKDNPQGYKDSSVTLAADKLHGRLLLVHGMIDDNVHMQNSIEFVDALQKANKDFDIMLYPHARHGIAGAHYQRLNTEHMKRYLQPGT